MESSVTGFLEVLTGLDPGLWVWGTGGRHCLLTKEGVNWSLKLEIDAFSTLLNSNNVKKLKKLLLSSHIQ